MLKNSRVQLIISTKFMLRNVLIVNLEVCQSCLYFKVILFLETQVIAIGKHEKCGKENDLIVKK